MAFRGGGGRGGRFGRGAPKRRANEEPVELFPEINCLRAVEYSEDEIWRYYSQFVNWSNNLHIFFETPPYWYEDRSQRLERQKVDIERYSDRKSQATYVKPPLWHFIKMDTDHMPEELARGDNRVAKKVRWDNEFDLNKLDVFEKLDEKYQGKEGAARNEEGEEEEIEENEEDGEFSDEGDYEQNEHFDDDDDYYNMEGDNDEAEY